MSDDLGMLLRTASYLAFEDGTNDYTTPALAAARITKMTEVMELALRYFENRIDVNDGDYGVSEANREMVLYNHMKKVLDNE